MLDENPRLLHQINENNHRISLYCHHLWTALAWPDNQMMPCQGCPLQTGVLPAQQVAGQYDGLWWGGGGQVCGEVGGSLRDTLHGSAHCPYIWWVYVYIYWQHPVVELTASPWGVKRYLILYPSDWRLQTIHKCPYIQSVSKGWTQLKTMTMTRGNFLKGCSALLCSLGTRRCWL